MSKVRVRFAPSPTGGLHIGGVRTALFNYLFAKKNQGDFILRIEDTDQNRFVEGAEKYILDALNWIGITPDESPETGGEFAPYRQSERKEMYAQYAQKLLDEGNAYYAFDTEEELNEMREKQKAARIATPKYDVFSRGTMKNSLTLSEDEVKQKIAAGEPYVIRIKIPAKEEIRLNDAVRGWVMVLSETLDDKVIVKSDGMPTYHLANVVDDYLMKITHVIRGEEWLPSAPLHVLLYQFLGWEDVMPKFAHLPLILKPDGNGKLSKRAADKAGFPIFPLNWTDPTTQETSQGFKEYGFLPEALTNFLSLLGWNSGTEQEIFSMQELIESFSMERINKAPTKFDLDKAKWFNQQYIKSYDNQEFASQLKNELASTNVNCTTEQASDLVELLKGRITFPHEFTSQSKLILENPTQYDEKVVRKKWNEDAEKAMKLFKEVITEKSDFSAEEAKDFYWKTLEENGLKPGQFMQVLRLCLTGEGSGPDLMMIVKILGGEETANRISYSVEKLNAYA